jgi:hypothetical protein
MGNNDPKQMKVFKLMCHLHVAYKSWTELSLLMKRNT